MLRLTYMDCVGGNPYEIYVDDVCKCRIKGGEVKEFDVRAGRRTVIARRGEGFFSEKYKLNLNVADAGEIINVEMRPLNWLGSIINFLCFIFSFHLNRLSLAHAMAIVIIVNVSLPIICRPLFFMVADAPAAKAAKRRA